MENKTKNSVLLAILFLVVVCCAILFYRVNALEQKVDRISERTIEADKYARLEELFDRLAQTSQAAKEEEAPEETVEATDDVAHKVYLTFDDGPSIYTDEILDILAEYDVKATFFVVGKEDEHSQAAIRRIVDEGHTLGMHSYSHKYVDLYDSLDSFKEDFEKQQNYLEELTGVKSKVYRFPGGSSNTVSNQDMRFFAYYLDSQDVVFYDWNVDSGDAASRHTSVDILVQNSTTTIPRWKTSIVLMHDAADKHTTVEALPQIIETIQAMKDTEILPITEDTTPIQHLHR
ncbi:MAG: polysaccharide deacetylase [Lachnospiraceae bacterium]|nr:polysaccharide deacetylase [Lachnospiraceae bacterium]